MKALAALLLALVALVALAGGGGADDEAASVRDLGSLDELRADFEADAGATRVVLLFAPT